MVVSIPFISGAHGKAPDAGIGKSSAVSIPFIISGAHDKVDFNLNQKGGRCFNPLHNISGAHGKGRVGSGLVKTLVSFNPLHIKDSRKCNILICLHIFSFIFKLQSFWTAPQPALGNEKPAEPTRASPCMAGIRVSQPP